MRTRSLAGGIALVVIALLVPFAHRLLAFPDTCFLSGGGGANSDPGTPLIIQCAPTALVEGKGNGLLTQASGSPIQDPDDPPNRIIVLDVNGDGSPDLVTFSYRGASVYRGNGHGGFTKSQTIIFGCPCDGFNGVQNYDASDVVTVDVNSDGHLDIVVSGHLMDNDFHLFPNFVVLLGQADGTLAAAGPTVFDTLHLGFNDQPLSLDAADLTGDGFADLAMLYYGDGRAYLRTWTGDGSGNFVASPPMLTGTFSPHDLKLADVDADGDVDVVILDLFRESLTGQAFLGGIFHNDGGGGLSPIVGIGEPGGVFGAEMALGDVNGDGLRDFISSDRYLVSVTLGDATSPSGFGAAPSSSHSGFGGPLLYPSTNRAGLTLADMDGDGKTDVVGLFAGLSVLFGTGSESLLSGPSEFPLPAYAFDMEVADLNGDGKLDVVVAHPLGLISIFLNGRVTIDSLSAAVNALGLAGGQANSLQAKLRAATASQARGDTRTAANQLNAFIDEVNAMKRSRRLSAAQFNALITLAQQVIAGL